MLPVLGDNITAFVYAVNDVWVAKWAWSSDIDAGDSRQRVAQVVFVDNCDFHGIPLLSPILFAVIALVLEFCDNHWYD